MRRLVLLVVLAALVANPAAWAAPEKRVALIIGAAKYENAPALLNPVNDAELIAPVVAKLGFQTQLIINPTYEIFKRALHDFGQRLAGASVGLFYYAGHGLQVSGRNYLMPVDARLETEIDLHYEAFDIQTVLDQMGASGRVSLMFLDACRDNPLSRSLAAHLASRSAAVAQGLAAVQARSGGTLIAYATAPDSLALDGDGPNSPFTSALARHIATPGLDVQLMLRNVRRDVLAATNGAQRPWETGSLDAAFYFAASPGQPAPSEPGGGRVSPELALWQSIAGSNRPGDFKAYLQQFPQGVFAALARARLATLLPERPAPLPEPASATAAVLRDCPECPEMVLIPAGSFRMGMADPAASGDAADDRDGGQGRMVRIGRAFYLGKYLVTREQYVAFAQATGRSLAQPVVDDQPVANVNWHDAVAYAAWLSQRTGQFYRLPTEAEWEYAARTGLRAARDWEGGAPAASSGNGIRPNGVGVYALLGNAWQWMQDCYTPESLSLPADGSVYETKSCPSRVLRGGSRGDISRWLRAMDPPGERGDRIGFRVARSLAPMPVPAPVPAPAPDAEATIRNCPTCPGMVLIPAATVERVMPEAEVQPAEIVETIAHPLRAVRIFAPSYSGNSGYSGEDQIPRRRHVIFPLAAMRRMDHRPFPPPPRAFAPHAVARRAAR